jgi:hypothetical protein
MINKKATQLPEWLFAVLAQNLKFEPRQNVNFRVLINAF